MKETQAVSKEYVFTLFDPFLSCFTYPQCQSMFDLPTMPKYVQKEAKFVTPETFSVLLMLLDYLGFYILNQTRSVSLTTAKTRILPSEP